MLYKKPVLCSTVIKNNSKHETGTDDSRELQLGTKNDHLFQT